MRLPCLPLVASVVAVLPLISNAAVEVKDVGGKVRVEISGQLFTELCYTGASHVYYHPVIGPGGAKMTRSWPMEEAPGEEHDHPHHRSLWFSHGDVNGVDFWSEAATGAGKDAKHPVGKIEHVDFVEVKGGPGEGVIKSRNRWVAPDGSVPLTAVETFRVYERPDSERLVDFEEVLTAGETEVVFGDTKEGTMAIRIAESMRLIQPKKKVGAGHIVNETGEKDADVWGKRAAWVDMSGPVGGKTLGIAMFDHPKNLRHPTRWHARDYGLFAANPFCEREMDESQPKDAGAFKLPAGQSVTFRYRIYIHEGDAAQAKVAERFGEYAAQSLSLPGLEILVPPPKTTPAK